MLAAFLDYSPNAFGRLQKARKQAPLDEHAQQEVHRTTFWRWNWATAGMGAGARAALEPGEFGCDHGRRRWLSAAPLLPRLLLLLLLRAGATARDYNQRPQSSSAC